MSKSLRQFFTSRPLFQDVEVLGIRTGATREPLRVRINRPDRREIAEVMTALPGRRPQEPTVTDPVDAAEADELAERLVAKFASVQLPDGEWVCPCFSFSNPPDPNLLDGNELALHELRILALTILYLGGYAGSPRGEGAAAPSSFLGKRGRRTRGN